MLFRDRKLAIFLFGLAMLLANFSVNGQNATPTPPNEERKTVRNAAGKTTPTRDGVTLVAAKEQADQQFRKWQRRVDEFTKEIVSESSSVSDNERAVYLALLAKLWWKVDEPEARNLLKTSASKLKSLDQKNNSAPGMRLFHFQRALEIIAGLDLKIAQKVIADLKGPGDESDDVSEPDAEMADLFVTVGLMVVESNPQLALAYGLDSLRYGFATQLPALAVKINLKDSLFAQTLIRRALDMVRLSSSRSSHLMIFNLDRYMAEFNEGRAFSNQLRRAVVETFVAVLETAAEIEQERPTRCKVAGYAPRFMPRVEEYFPAIIVVVRQNFEICLPFASETIREQVKAAVSDELPKTVDELLKAARDTKNINLKIGYYRQALGVYEKEKRFDEMISVLDGLDGDDFRKHSPVGWAMWRSGAASDAALAAYAEKDLPAVYRYIDKTPKSLRPDVRKQLAQDATVVKNKEFLLENLEEMQKELGAIEQACDQAVNFYLLLTRLYLDVLPTESQSTFRGAVKEINRCDADNPDFLPDKDWAIYQYSVPMRSELLEIDEISMASLLNKLSSGRSRVRLKLGFLESSLKDYALAKKKLDDLTKSTRTDRVEIRKN